MTSTNHYGPYDVTDYETWQAALDAGITEGSELTSVTYGNTVMFVEVTGGVSVSDDGTYVKFAVAGTTLFRVRKSDGQFQVAGGYDTDITL